MPSTDKAIFTFAQQLYTELTPEEEVPISGGADALYTTDGVTTRLRIRESPNLRSDIIGFLKPNSIFFASFDITNGFRKLLNRKGWVSADFTKPSDIIVDP